MKIVDVRYKKVDSTADERDALEKVSDLVNELTDYLELAADEEVIIGRAEFSLEKLLDFRYFLSNICENDFNIQIKKI